MVKALPPVAKNRIGVDQQILFIYNLTKKRREALAFPRGGSTKDLLLWLIFTAVWGRERHDFGRLAQWLERLLHTQEATGSSPVPPTIV